MKHKPVLGGTAPRHAVRTARKLAGFALKYTPSIQQGSATQAARRYLDAGCGNGFITEHVAGKFDQVVGIDIEKQRLRQFVRHAWERAHYLVAEMSSDCMGVRSESFCFITAFEVLEHVEHLEETVSEMVRACQPGGVIVVSVPQVWFPLENHGMQIGKRVIHRKIPLLPYIRPLHRRYALARVFSSRAMDRLFVTRGMQLLATGYVSPQFERAAANTHSWEHKLTFLRLLLTMAETVPLLRNLVGVSMLKAYRKPAE